MAEVRKRCSQREDRKLTSFLTNSLKLAGLVSVSFICYAVGFFLKDIFSEKNCPEMMAYRKEKQERRRRFLLRKLHEKQMKELNTKAKKRKNDFYK
ncbi:MAG: hypothetical protein FVQ79_14375 [Planctomycetes bacterium]|nr:hypothetical protein [Planctomycetota bacterium]